MGQIKQLDAKTVEQIAAGEVIERPASVVKELVENAIDAKASRIDIAIQNGGISEIIIQDNGVGIPQSECILAFSNHATSKLATITDLHSLLTMGFRGEALASIAAISHVTLISKPRKQAHAYKVEFAASELKSEGLAALSDGTQLIVRDLFYNVPARYKFLKKDQGEVQAITRIVTEEALAAPEIAFTLSSNGKVLLQTPGNNDLLSTIQALFGSEIADSLLPIQADESYNLHCRGFIGKANLSRKSRRMEYFFINKRSFSSALVTKALEAALQDYLMTRSFPVAFLFLDLAPNLVDVNVHPRKLEVRFWNENEVYKAVYHQVKQAMLASLAMREIESEKTFEQDKLDLANSSRDISTDNTNMQNEQSSFSELTKIKNEETYFPQTVVKAKISTNLKPKATFSHMMTNNTNINNFSQTETVAKILPLQPTVSSVKENASNYIADKQAAVIKKAEGNSLLALASANFTRIDGQRNELLKLKTATYIGQLHATYLLFDAAECLFIVDQHAMHERINYERLLKQQDEQFEDNKLQHLLVPYEFTLQLEEALLLQDNLAFLKQNGYLLTQKNTNTFILTALNQTESHLNLANLVQTLLSDLDSSARLTEDNLSNKQERIIASRACRSSIMANDYVAPELVKKLLPALFDCVNPFQCPHGRPTCLMLKRYAIEKAFKRKV